MGRGGSETMDVSMVSVPPRGHVKTGDSLGLCSLMFVQYFCWITCLCVLN